jgi:hypothetical protein
VLLVVHAKKDVVLFSTHYFIKTDKVGYKIFFNATICNTLVAFLLHCQNHFCFKLFFSNVSDKQIPKKNPAPKLLCTIIIKVPIIL